MELRCRPAATAPSTEHTVTHGTIAVWRPTHYEATAAAHSMMLVESHPSAQSQRNASSIPLTHAQRTRAAPKGTRVAAPAAAAAPLWLRLPVGARWQPLPLQHLPLPAPPGSVISAAGASLGAASATAPGACGSPHLRAACRRQLLSSSTVCRKL